MTKIRTYQIRWHRSETGGDDQVEHHFDDEPATMATASIHIMMLARELNISIADAMSAMKLLP